MGFTSNTVSYTTYEVLQAPNDLKEALVDGLKQGKIHAIDIEAGRDKAAGFAVFDDPLSTDFAEENTIFNPLILFSFRMDKLTVPTSTLKLYVAQRVRENLLATRREKMPRQERDELAEMVKTDLMKRAIPAINGYDVVWDTNTNRIRIFTTSASVCEEFVARAQTFLQLELRPLNTVGVLEQHLTERELNEAYHLLPTTFLAPSATMIRFKEDM
ncbi:MAG: recombination-associated protein RdgC [Myxococcota bacterium]|jgi:DNA recombination-dependent growth factor C